MNSPAAAESTPRPQYASVRALALKYGVSETTIWRWAQQGRIPTPTKFGPNTTRWDVEAVDAALAKAADAAEGGRMMGQSNKTPKPPEAGGTAEGAAA